jgi:DNA-binding CsgD family transcriptional regulator
MAAHATVSALIDYVYEAPLAPDGWNSLVPALEEALGGGVAIFVRRDDQLNLLAACTSCTSDQAQDYGAQLWREDRAMDQLASAPVGAVIRDSSLVTRRERLRSPFYNDYLGSLGNECGIYASFSRSGEGLFVVSAQRHARHGDFSDEDAQMLRTLRPHLERSVRTWQRLRRVEEAQDAAVQALDHARMGFVIVDRQARVQFANEAAEALFQSGILRVLDGRIASRARAENEALRLAIVAATRPERAVADTVDISGSDRPVALSVLISPLTRGETAGAREPLAMLVFGDGAPARVEASRLGRAYDLTPAEAKLLSALVSGERLGTYAASQGISVTTAKSHLSSLFDKTGERRQADLIRRALADPIFGISLPKAA